MASQASGNGNRWQIWVGTVAVGLTLVGALIKVGDITAGIEANKTAYENQQARLNRMQDTLNLLQNRVAASDAANEEKLKEIETQFRAFDQLSDVRIAEDLRWRALIWEKLYGQKYPDILYPPQIAK